jgi:hypothetical protein
MPEVTKVILGRPGPPGAGVTPAEKASYVAASGTNVFTAAQTVRFSSANGALIVQQASGSANDAFTVATNPKRAWYPNSVLLQGYSDAYTTEKWRIDSATGNAQFDGYVQADGGIRGDVLRLTLPIIDGGGSAITTGVKADFQVPYDLSIFGWTLLADTSGSISIELWKDTYANYPPTVADLVTGTTGTNNPRISSSNKNTSTVLTNWTTAWTAGDVIRMNVASATTITRVSLILWIWRT